MQSDLENGSDILIYTATSSVFQLDSLQNMKHSFMGA